MDINKTSRPTVDERQSIQSNERSANQSDENSPRQAVEHSTGQPDAQSPGQPDEQSPGQPDEQSPRQPDERSPRRSDEVPIIQCDEISIEPTEHPPRQENEVQCNDAENPDGHRLSDKTYYLKIFILRLYVYSPVKLVDCTMKCSALHIIWVLIHMGKLVVLTWLILDIGHCRETLASTVTGGYIALQHTLLKDWDASFETLPYPPAHGQYASYSIEDMKSKIDYSVAKIYNIEAEANGYFKRMPVSKVVITIDYYNIMAEVKGTISNVNVEESTSFEPRFGLSNFTNKENITVYAYDVTKDLENMNLSTVLHRMLALEVNFVLYSLRVDLDSKETRCLHINGTVSFNNVNNNGQVIIKLTTITFPIQCDFSTHDIEQCEKHEKDIAIAVLAFAGITVLVDSAIFLAGTCVLGRFFISPCCCCCSCCCNNKDECSISEFLLNIQWWIAMSIVGDGFTLRGTFWIQNMLRGQLSKEALQLRNWDNYVVYLGLGCLLAWFSFARFFRMHHKFTILIKTIRMSAVDIFLFMICVFLIFVGFWTCSYIVLGPYHIKFKKQTTSAETLFSLINGDEIFATFSILQDEYAGDANKVYVFSRVLIYTFVTLFTILVLNLLIAIFNNAYEVVREKKNELEKKQVNDQNEVRKKKIRTLRDIINNCSPKECCCNCMFKTFQSKACSKCLRDCADEND